MRLKNKRGLAIEMAIAFMLVTFALCAMLLVIAFSASTRTRRSYVTANDFFTLDQLGEYFVRGIEENKTANFMKDIADEDGNIDKDDPSKVRGGWFKYVNSSSTTGTEFGLNVSNGNQAQSSSASAVGNGTYTMRVTYWDKVGWDASAKKANVDEDDVLLIVTVCKQGDTYTVTNWSNQLVQYTENAEDKPEAEDLSFFEWLWRLLLRLLGFIIDVITTVIDLIFGLFR